MSILVRKDGENWVRWNDTQMVEQTFTTANVSYADGRQEEITVPPYTVPVSIDGNRVKQFYDDGIWGEAEVNALGGKFAFEFEVPEGFQTVGEEWFLETENGRIDQMFEVEVIPPPPEPPTAAQKYAAFLEAIGLTHTEFMAQLT